MDNGLQRNGSGRTSGVLLGGLLVVVGYTLGTMHSPKRAEAVQGAGNQDGRFALIRADDNTVWKLDTTTGEAWRNFTNWGWDSIPAQLNRERAQRQLDRVNRGKP